MTKNKKGKEINLRSLPSGWDTMTLEQFKIIEDIHGKYPSTEAYLANCFLALEGLKPLRHAEKWRTLLGSMPLFGRYVADTGRQIAHVYEDILQPGQPFILWKQCYSFKGFWNSVLGKRFFMEDQELLSFQKSITFLTNRDDMYMTTNPVCKKKIGLCTYRSYYTKLADISWHEYRLCCMHIQNYTSTRQYYHLNAFLSTLYKPEGWINSVKRFLTGKTHPVNFIKKFSPLQINLILLFWNSTQQYYKKCFKHLYTNKEEKINRDFLKEEIEITVFLSKEINTTPDDTQKINALYALQYLEDNAILQEEKKKELDRIKRMR